MDGHYGSCVPTAIRVEQMRMIRNLIEVKVLEDQLNSANFKDGLKIRVKSEKPFIVNAYWIVKINDIHREIEKDWRSLLQELREGKFLTGTTNGVVGAKKKPIQTVVKSSLYQNDQQIYRQTHEEVECDIRPPCDIDTSQMTQTPRDFYPLVILVTCLDEDPDPMAADAGANIHIIHIKDSIVPIRSHVIKQYIKQIDGRILDISQLYQEESAACFICFEDVEDGLKLFCLLPCRHSPICSNCILRIRECPKCRCPIASVFDINSPGMESLPPATAAAAGPRPTIDPSVAHLYNDDNDNATGNTSTSTNRQDRAGGFMASLKSFIGL